MAELIIEYNEQYNFNKVYCPNNHYITSFNPDTDDIMTFSACKELYCPTSIDVEATYHCITDYMYKKYTKQREDAFQEKIDDEEVGKLWEENKDDKEAFYNALVEKFGEDEEKIKKYLEKYIN